MEETAKRSALHGQKVAFVGAGAMAESLIRAMVATGAATPGHIRVTNRSRKGRLDDLRERYGIVPAQDPADCLAGADIVILCAKPADMRDAALLAARHAPEEALFVSVAAGCAIAWLEGILAAGRGNGRGHRLPRVVRAMPNTSSAVLESVTAFSLGLGCRPEDRAVARDLFSAMGLAREIPESLLDAATGLSGTGPAYVYFLVESLIRAGTDLGFDAGVSADFVLHTLFGAAKMLRETGQPPEILRAAVTSPGGTTMAGIGHLEREGFDAAVRGAVRRAAERAAEMRAAIEEGGPHLESEIAKEGGQFRK